MRCFRHTRLRQLEGRLLFISPIARTLAFRFLTPQAEVGSIDPDKGAGLGSEDKGPRCYVGTQVAP